MNNPIDTANELIKEIKSYKNHDDLFDTLIETRRYIKGHLNSWKEELEFLEELTKRKSFGIIKYKTGIAILMLDRIGDLQSAIIILEKGLK
jgi:hypothetical protein